AYLNQNCFLGYFLERRIAINAGFDGARQCMYVCFFISELIIFHIEGYCFIIETLSLSVVPPTCCKGITLTLSEDIRREDLL
ncbi:MAG TPA: hypothetical protein DEG69_16120, partial [Flavobacteriaceae bacterium]|nr:hypothetical protein [Flavobacteriaceae bacterium]